MGTHRHLWLEPSARWEQLMPAAAVAPVRLPPAQAPARIGRENGLGNAGIAPLHRRLHQVPRRPEQVQGSGKCLGQAASALTAATTAQASSVVPQHSSKSPISLNRVICLVRQLQLGHQLAQYFRVLALRLGRPDLLRNVFVDRVRASHPAIHRQRNGMHFQIEDLSVLASPSRRRMQGLSQR